MVGDYEDGACGMTVKFMDVRIYFEGPEQLLPTKNDIPAVEYIVREALTKRFRSTNKVTVQ